MPANPTDQQSEVEAQATVSKAVSTTWLVSTGEELEIDQETPSQCMAKACRARSRVSLDWPTAQQSDMDRQVTSAR
jgi:hypothetical protein